MTVPLHAMPPCKVDGAGFEKCPFDAYTQDPELERATEGSLMGALIRMVGGYLKRKPKWSRTRVAMHSTPGGWVELGWAHLARTKAAQVLSDIAKNLPEQAQYAWGDEAAKMRDKDYNVSVLESAKGTGRMPSELDWLVAGWHQISRLGAVQDVYLRRWYSDFVSPVLSWMQKKNLKHGTTLAAGVRLNNSSPTWFQHLQKRVVELGEGPGTLKAVSEYAQWSSPSMTKSKNRRDRMDAIYSEPFQVDSIGSVSPDQISWSEDGGLPLLDDSALVPAGGSAAVQQIKRHWKPMVAVGGVIGVGVAVYLLWIRKPKKKKKKRRRKRR